MALRLWSCLFSLVLGIFAAGVSVVLLSTGATNYNLDMLPFWKGSTALYGLLFIGLVGIAAAVLAFLGKARILLVLFTLAALTLLVYGFFVNPLYRFPGAAEAKNLAWVSLGGLVAFLGSLAQFRKQRA